MKDIKFTIVDSHHKVLESWARYRRSLKTAPRLLTLDHHTDTSKPFRNYIHRILGPNSPRSEELRSDLLRAMDYRNPDSVLKAIEKLSNDEHIVTAIDTDIISMALVVAHNAYDTDMSTYREHKIVCRSVGRNPDVKRVSRDDCDRVLETEFLDKVVSSFDQFLWEANQQSINSQPYILDIDLDFFNTFESYNPKDVSTFRRLIQNAGLVTIATEPEYVKKCALDAGLTSELPLKALEELFLN